MEFRDHIRSKITNILHRERGREGWGFRGQIKDMTMSFQCDIFILKKNINENQEKYSTSGLFDSKKKKQKNNLNFDWHRKSWKEFNSFAHLIEIERN